MYVTQLPDIFNLGDIENKAILKACSQAHLALGRLNGIALTIPSPDILLSTLPLQEAKESLEIESIIMTNETADIIHNLYKYPYNED